MITLSKPSPAKVNLFFRVLSKREDGFHEIASLYSTINLCDTVKVSLSESDEFICEEAAVPLKSNLVLKARDLFFQKTGKRSPLKIHLEKKIPIGAGLGGGSSNAATTLLLLNELFDSPLSQDELMRLGSELGSDVPFFFTGGLAYCTGRGELIETIASEHRYEAFIAKPKELLLSTSAVYGACIPNESSTDDPVNLLEAYERGKPTFVNDLEPAAFRLLPELFEIKEGLKELGFDHITMTGSGTAFVCIGNVEKPTLPQVDFYPISFS